MLKVFRPTLSLICLLSIFCAQSCRPTDSRESLQKVNQLENLVQEIDATLIIDPDIIRSRRDSMEIKLNRVLEYFKDSGNAETKSDITKYAAIMTNYEKLIEDYPVTEFDFQKKKAEAAELKDAVLKDEIKDEDFEEQFNIQKQALEKLLEDAKHYAFMVYSTEPDFKRSSETLNKLYTQATKQ